MKYLPLFLILTSCGYPTYKHDPSFNSYIDEWTKDFQYDGAPIWFDDREGRTAATCTPGYGIKIDPIIWETSGKRTKKAIIFHELAHCIYHIKHIDTRYEDHCPVSLMSPILPSETCLERYELEYYQGLINIITDKVTI